MNSFLLYFLSITLWLSVSESRSSSPYPQLVESHLVVRLPVALFTAHINSRISEHKNLLL